MSDEQYAMFLAKDSYSYLRNEENKEYIIGAMMMGYDASTVFETCDEEQVKEIYKAILSIISQPQWSAQKVEEAIHNANPSLTDKEVVRIRRTELQRILAFAKEQSALEENDNHYYAWVGALDDRTTPICRYLQTGELSHKATNPNFADKDYDYSYLQSKLPQWKEHFTMSELKQFIRDTYEVFHDEGIINTLMISDWSPHINCRHTFTQTDVIPKEEFNENIDIDNYFPSDQAVEMVADLDSQNEVVVEKVDYGDSDFIFLNSRFYIQPVYYYTPNAKEEDTVFSFESDEYAVAEESDYIEQRLRAGTDKETLMWELKDRIHLHNITEEEITWLMEKDRYLWFNKVADEMGWIY